MSRTGRERTSECLRLVMADLQVARDIRRQAEAAPEYAPLYSRVALKYARKAYGRLLQRRALMRGNARGPFDRPVRRYSAEAATR